MYDEPKYFGILNYNRKYTSDDYLQDYCRQMFFFFFFEYHKKPKICADNKERLIISKRGQ